MRRLLLALLVALPAAAAAQLRTIPAEAMVGTIRHLEAMVVEVNGQAVQLSPGAQIRDPDNRLVLPASLAQPILVRFLVDGMGQVHRVWILSADEIAALPPPPYPR